MTGLAANASPDTTGKIAITAYMFEHLEIASYRRPPSAGATFQFPDNIPGATP